MNKPQNFEVESLLSPDLKRSSLRLGGRVFVEGLIQGKSSLKTGPLLNLTQLPLGATKLSMHVGMYSYLLNSDEFQFGKNTSASASPFFHILMM